MSLNTKNARRGGLGEGYAAVAQCTWAWALRSVDVGDDKEEAQVGGGWVGGRMQERAHGVRA